MPDAYIYRSDLYCGHCAKKIKNALSDAGTNPNQIARGDSENWPQGPFSRGGGEADGPLHCGACSLFLENPLTADGYEYVCEAIGGMAYHGDGNRDVLRQWADFYQNENTILDNAIQEWQALRPEDWR